MFSQTTANFWHVQLRLLVKDVMNTLSPLVNTVTFYPSASLPKFPTLRRQGATFA
jgi:hypothetical protein